MTIYINAIDYGSPLYERAVSLRKHVLYTPYGETLDESRDRKKIMFGLLDDDQLIGWMLCDKKGENLHLEEIIVDYGARGHGYGGQMLRFLESGRKKDTFLTAVGPLSCRRFFEKSGFTVKSKHKGPKDRMRIDLEKRVSGAAKNPLPRVEERQKRPLLYVTTQSKGFELIPVLRNHYPKEHLFVLDLPDSDALWLQMTREIISRVGKYTLIAPHLYGDRHFHPLDDFHLPSLLAEETDRRSRTKTVLLLGTESEFSGRDYRAAMETKNASLSTVELALERENAVGEDLYDVLAEKMETLKESPFDTVAFVDAALSVKADAVEKFLEQELLRDLEKIDVFQLLVAYLRRQLVKENLIRHDSTPGELRIFSETPKKARRELKSLHPTEGNAPIDTIR